MYKSWGVPYHKPISDKRHGGAAQSGLGLLVEAEKLMQIAILLPSATFLGWLGGAWMDGRFRQKWMALAGMLFGAASGLAYVIRLAMAAETQASKADAAEEKQN